MRARTGLAARVLADGIEVVVHTDIVRLIDPAVFEALGADLAAMAIVQAKSHVSYRAGFARVSARSIVADTRGPSAADLRLLPYRRRPRPMFPFEPVEELGSEGFRCARPHTPDRITPEMTGNESSTRSPRVS
jgi:microcystin degradation protein MlrC